MHPLSRLKPPNLPMHISTVSIYDSSTAPHSRFHGETSPHRVVTTATFDFRQFQKLRRIVPGATINDLAFSIFGGALRHYLIDKGEPVDTGLIAQIPVDIRTDAQLEEDGNQITTINASCGSDIEDPVLRLDAVVSPPRRARSDWRRWAHPWRKTWPRPWGPTSPKPFSP
jgi:diacylglycerol O-acyltransferase